MRWIAVPRLEGEHLAHFAIDEILCALQALVEPLHVTNLQFHPARRHCGFELLHLFQRHAKWHFTQHMLAGGKARRAPPA